MDLFKTGGGMRVATFDFPAVLLKSLIRSMDCLRYDNDGERHSG